MNDTGKVPVIGNQNNESDQLKIVINYGSGNKYPTVQNNTTINAGNNIPYMQ